MIGSSGGTRKEGFSTKIRLEKNIRFEAWIFIFLAASPPPVEGTMPFSLARGRSNLDFQMKASPTIYFLCSALVKFEGEGGRERKKRRTRSSYRYPDGTANFDESFSNGGAKPALSLSSVLGTLCARLLSARATGECYKSSSSFVRGGCRVDKCPFVNQKTLSFLSLSLFSLREASSNRTPDTFSFYLDLRELLFALGKNVARAMQPDTEYYFSYIIARNGIKVLLKFWGRRDLRGSIDFSMIFFLTKFDRIF